MIDFLRMIRKEEQDGGRKKMYSKVDKENIGMRRS